MAQYFILFNLMYAAKKILLDFIHDFELEINDDNDVCFDAVIEYFTADFFIKIESAVHIITTKYQNFSLIYLLHLDLARYSLPDKLRFDPLRFRYIKGTGLWIRGTDSKKRNYRLGIKPLNTSCAHHTLTELKAKKYN